MTYRVLHLSDIHFGQKSGTVAKHDHIRNALINDAQNVAKKRGPAARILVTGDVAFSGKADEYETASQWLEKLAAACGCKETDVSTIPGNHDCDRAAISNQARMLYATLRTHSPETIQATLAEINQDGDAANPFLPKLQAYSKFSNAYGCNFGSSARPFWTRDISLSEGMKLRLYGLTSVQVSNGDDALGNMILGNEQYMISEHPNVINVVLLHHPLDWFKDKAEAAQFLQNNARLIMVGHEHALNIHKTEDALAKKEWLVLFAGATNPPDGENYGFTYNWIEFSCAEKNNRHFLVVEIFPRIWIQQSVRFEADHNRLGGAAESAKIEIACPNLQRAPTIGEARGRPSAQGAAGAVKEIEVEVKSSTSVATRAVLAREGEPVMSIESAEFDRLRYLFWRYLDWRQRLKVLVAVDALPKTADQPVPQTLERVALESAAHSVGKLHDLWEAMMPLIPEDKRASNPFKSK